MTAVPAEIAAAAVELSRIVRDPAIQPRESLDHDTVGQYAESMSAGAVFPPVVVYHDGASYWLSQGFHRCMAAERAGLATILAEVRRGTRQDALWDAAGSNREHDTVGMRRSSADRRRAVLMALAARPGLSDRAIAEQVGVDHKTVGQVRANWGNSPVDRRVGLDGKSRPAPVGRTPPDRPEPESEREPTPQPGSQLDESSSSGRVGLDGKSRPAPNGLTPRDEPEPERKPHFDSNFEDDDGPEAEHEHEHEREPVAGGAGRPVVPGMPIVLTDDAPAFPKVPGGVTRSAYQHWIRDLLQIIIEVREHDGIDGSTNGISAHEKEFLKNTLINFCSHAKQLIKFLEGGDGQG